VHDVLVVAGTCRPGSTTGRLAVDVAALVAASGLVTRVVEVGELGLPICDGGPVQAELPEVRSWRALATASPAQIWVSPEWHGSMAGSLKNALDHLRVEDLQGRAVGLVAQAGGGMDAISALDHMRAVGRAFGCWVVPTQVSLRAFELEDRVSGIAQRLGRLADELSGAASLVAPRTEALSLVGPS